MNKLEPSRQQAFEALITSIEWHKRFDTRWARESTLLRTVAPDLGDDARDVIADVCRVLRLIDRFLAAKDTGEGFAAKMSEHWPSMRSRVHRLPLTISIDALDDLYEASQQFSLDADRLPNEPLVNGARLQERAIRVYNAVRSELVERVFERG